MDYLIAADLTFGPDLYQYGRNTIDYVESSSTCALHYTNWYTIGQTNILRYDTTQHVDGNDQSATDDDLNAGSWEKTMTVLKIHRS